MYTRIFFGTIQPGKSGDAWRVLDDFARKVREQPGYVLGQLLQSGDEIVAITTWNTKDDLARYADSDLARELFAAITPLFMGVPSVKSYEVKLSFGDRGSKE